MTQAPSIGFERLPREVARLLDEAADNAALAAAELAHLLAGGGEQLIREIELREERGDRITHDLARALVDPRLAASDRGLLRDLAETIDDVLDEIDAAAVQAASCRCGPDAVLVSEVLRDMTRASARVIRALDEPMSEWGHEIAAIRSLHRDGERFARRALAEALRDGTEPLDAIVRQGCLAHLTKALQASARTAIAAERTSLATRS